MADTTSKSLRQRGARVNDDEIFDTRFDKRRDSTVPPGMLPRPDTPENETESTESAENPVSSAQVKVAEAESKIRKTVIRGISAICMIAIFLLIIWSGAAYLTLMVIGLQLLVFRELVNVRYSRYQADKQTQNAEVPLFRTLQYWWFLVGMSYMYTDFLTVYAKGKSSMMYLSQWMQLAPWLCFVLFASALLISILTLRPAKGTIRYQMGHFSWTVVSLVMVCGQMFYAPRMIYTGMFWFVLPASLVIFNDISAYAWGRMFGRMFIKAQFLAISPNKTWEGFLGALFVTLPVSYWLAGRASDSQFLVCPTPYLTLMPHPHLECDPAPVFVSREYIVPDFLVSLSSGLMPPVWTCRPVQLHILLVSTVASLVTPFGGFLASAIKRANGVKDFDSIIPGHGGFTDRFDCQMLMSLYVWMHYKSLVLVHQLPMDRIIYKFAMLSTEDKRLVLTTMHQMVGDVGGGE